MLYLLSHQGKWSVISSACNFEKINYSANLCNVHAYMIILDWYKWSCILLIVLFSDPVYLAPEVFLLDSELLTSEGTTRRRTLSSSDETELLNPPSSPNTDSWSLGVVLLQYLAVNLKYQSSCLDYCNCKVYEETLRSCTMMADNQQANLHWSERMPVIQS